VLLGGVKWRMKNLTTVNNAKVILGLDMISGTGMRISGGMGEKNIKKF